MDTTRGRLTNCPKCGGGGGEEKTNGQTSNQTVE